MSPKMIDNHPPHGEKWEDGASGAAVECRDIEFSYPQRTQAKVLKEVSVEACIPLPISYRSTNPN